jgi:IclR family pca regulon transcriptional regulator
VSTAKQRNIGKAPAPHRVSGRSGGGAQARAGGKEYMASLAKGLAVLGAFSERRPTMSLTEAAAVAGLSRAAARRVLLTLAELGFVEQTGRDFALAPRVLELGFAYLSIQSWIKRAEPLMRELSGTFQVACNAAILHGSEIAFVARIPAPSWILGPTIAVGSRLPAFHTSLGRIQLGFLPDGEIWRRLRATRIVPHTPNTILDPAALVERVKSDREQGFSIVDEELERDLRTIAVPVLSRSGPPVGAINLAAHAARVTRNEMRDIYLPQLREAAARISQGVV